MKASAQDACPRSRSVGGRSPTRSNPQHEATPSNNTPATSPQSPVTWPRRQVTGCSGACQSWQGHSRTKAVKFNVRLLVPDVCLDRRAATAGAHGAASIQNCMLDLPLHQFNPSAQRKPVEEWSEEEVSIWSCPPSPPQTAPQAWTLGPGLCSCARETALCAGARRR